MSLTVFKCKLHNSKEKNAFGLVRFDQCKFFKLEGGKTSIFLVHWYLTKFSNTDLLKLNRLYILSVHVPQIILLLWACARNSIHSLWFVRRVGHNRLPNHVKVDIIAAPVLMCCPTCI